MTTFARRGKLDHFTRLGAFVVGSAYVAGFVIVTLHHAQYGIGEISLLRARVLSAGILFGILTALPVAATLRQYGHFGLGPTVFGKIDVQPQNEWAASVIEGTWLCLPCAFLANLTVFLFQDWFREFANTHYSGWRMLLLMIFVFAILTATRRWVVKYPWTSVVVAVVAFVIFGTLVYTTEGLTFLLLTVWFFLCSLITRWTTRLFHEPSKWRTIEWELGVGNSLALVIFFSTFIYGHVQFRFGGGATVPVRLHLTADAPKLFATDPAPAFLLEETDSGFYVLKNIQDRSSLFLPRTIVKALEFNVKDGDGQSPSKQDP